jgi:hypothetical protein
MKRKAKTEREKFERWMGSWEGVGASAVRFDRCGLYEQGYGNAVYDSAWAAWKASARVRRRGKA